MLHGTPSRVWLAAAAAVCLTGVGNASQTSTPPPQHRAAAPGQHPQNHMQPAGSLKAPRPVTSDSAHLPPASAATQMPAPIVRRPAPAAPMAQVSANPHPPAVTGGETKNRASKDTVYGKGEHLTDWMNAHNGLTPAQQQQALEKEPGFRDLPAQTQQRIRGRLSELSTMTPDQRTKLLARNEQIEKLNPDQREQVRGAMTQLSELPPDQRKIVATSFRSLRGLPPNQRLAVLNSDRYRNLNDQQRSTLQRLMQVEPILPKDEAAK